MQYRGAFHDRNSERYMIEQRVGRLIQDLWGKYVYYSHVSTGQFDKQEGLIPHDELDKGTWEPFDGTRETWGEANGNVWFRQSFEIPEEMAGKTVIYGVNLRGNSGWYWGGPQILAYVNGKPTTGMGVNHREILLSDHATAGERYTVELCAFIDRFAYQGKVEMNMVVAALNTKVRKLYYDLKVPFDVACDLDVDDARRMDILGYLNTAVSMLDFRLPIGDAFDATVDAADAYMQEEFYGKFCGDSEVEITAVGHTHIDTAWLWTLEQTRKKVQRSYTTALRLMEQYPEYRFMAPQAQLYQFLKEELPEAYEQVKERIREGRWEVEGSMWVEPDTNIPSGESLVRQFLYGKKFFHDEFGQDTRVMWLPDVFGYSAALPQIMKKCGVDYFMTTKISWNDYNRLPYDTFRWRGIDGSEVLTHFITNYDVRYRNPEHFQTNYNAFLNADYAIGSWKLYQQKDINRHLLMCYGHGDGGGGPEFAMLEHGRRLAAGIPGCPKVKQGSVREYFENIDRELSDNKRLPVWDGELYFEYHRGTYTTVAKVKRNNRRSEFLLQDAELLSVMRRDLDGAAYPKDTLDEAWKLLLLNQFHDILPGSSIKEVYDDSDRQFETIRALGEGMVDAALDGIVAQVALDGDALVAFNTTAFERDGLVAFESDRENFRILDGGEELPWQRGEDGRVLFAASGIPAKGYKAFTLADGAPTAAAPVARIDGSTVETAQFRVRFDEHGHIASLYSYAMGREVVQNGEALNRLLALEDKPAMSDAWNIDAYVDEKVWAVDNLESSTVVENGPVRCVIRQQRRFMDSVIVQDLVFVKGVERIDVRNRIDWTKADQIMLKADFPFAVNAKRATFDIQFGNIERSTTENTSWEFAQFEECAHQWADLSEDAFGLSILNDCKYGYDIKKGHIRLTLLRSTTYPNPEADREVHEFTYSIYPHNGSWKQADTVRQAAFLNRPAYVRQASAHPGRLPEAYSYVSCEAANVVVDTVKRAEDGRNVVVRLYENNNHTTDTALSFAQPVKKAWECDMLEQVERELPVVDGRLPIHVKPFEVQTLRVEF